MTEHVLAIDLGTSGPKVALFTTGGAFVGDDSEAVGLRLLDGGGAEQSPAEWWRAVTAAARRVVGHARAADSVVAVSVTAQWSGTVPVGHDGEPLHDAIIWMDSRGAPAVREVVGGRLRVQGYDPRKLRRWIRLTGGAPARSGKDSIAHVLWLQREQPDVARATWLYLEPKDWLNYALTGVAVATHDSITLHWVTDNRRPDRVDYDPRLLATVGVPRAQLPTLVPATGVIGGLTPAAAEALGLPAGIPVAGGTPDVQSAALGSGAVRDHEGHLYVGTSSWITCHVPFKKTDLRHGVATLPSPLPGRYYVANEQETAGACLTWLRDRVLHADDALATPPAPADALERIDRLAATAPPGSNGVIFTPWLNGERTPLDDHRLRAGWHNLSLRTSRADLARAVLEGVALNSRWLLATVERFTARRFPWLHFIGGGARSEVWAQIMADVLGREIRVVEHPLDANVRGAALLGAVATGRASVEGFAAGARIARVHTPDPATARTYAELSRELRTIHDRTRGVYARLNAHD